jgi:hypothetical protein
MKTTKPVVLEQWYQDFNGKFVTHLIKNEEEHGDKEVILMELFRILNKRNITDADHQIQITSQQYPEYDQEEVRKSYQNDGVVCEILGQEEDRLILDNNEDTKDKFDIINYTILLPLWYIVYMFFDNYDEIMKWASADFQKMTKKELKEALQTYDETCPETHINHDVFMIDMVSGGVYNIGS